MINNNNPQTLLIVCGTRPEIIKLSPVYEQACEQFGQANVHWVSTGQHQKLEEETLENFGIEPDFRLDAGDAGGSLFNVYKNIINGLREVIRQVSPSMVIVQGDTISAYSGAFTAFHLKVPVAHVEAGLRTYDNDNPFPEEAYRCMIDSMASLYFAPTSLAADNLRKEGCDENHILTTGNTVIDALSRVDEMTTHLSTANLPVIQDNHKLIFVTMHRRESWDGTLSSMCHALRELADKYNDIHIVVPLHIKPKVQRQIKSILQEHPRITLLPPLNFVACHRLISKSYLVLTDSGGIQEEAPSYAVPVLVLAGLMILR